MPLFMSSSTSSKANVIYQKTVRPSEGMPSVLLLGYLVEYLQEHFQIPSKLPMVYESLPCAETSKAILCWDSPLSSSTETRMNVEIVGIYTDDEETSVPSMAMVVVSKALAPSKTSIAPMMQNLFADSEKRILRALDKGLDDFNSGKIKFNAESAGPPANIKTVEDAIQVELVENHPSQLLDLRSHDVVVDTTATSDMNTMASPSTPEEDYAVLAAKQAAARQTMQGQKLETKSIESASQDDFAVQAAKRAAAARKVKENGKVNPSVQAAPVSRESSDFEIKQAGPRRFTISTPKQRASKLAAKMNSNGQGKKGPSTRDPILPSSSDSPAENKPPMKEDTQSVTRRSVNLRVHETSDADTAEKELTTPFEAMTEARLDGNEEASNPKHGTRTVTQAEMERDVMQAAQKVMTELAEEGMEMSPEELLQDVLKYGANEDERNAEGRGFVSGAFEKAKELLREQKQMRDERLKQTTGFQEVSTTMNSMQMDILDPNQGPKELSPEEELKRIFEAGERLAEGRIEWNTSAKSQMAMSNADQEAMDEVDALIRGERTVSGYARSLDDELAELEVRINKSPGEERDGPSKNPLFDIFSGPELYNPNVDPETAVNWPGAQPGTKDLRIPKELDEAVKQAKFAADVLMNMKEVEGQEGTEYLVGVRKLTLQQVQNLRTIANEAVEIGLISDPLDFLAERSRLQMVVDELMGQPNERIREIASNYKDLLLSDDFVPLIKERLVAMADRDLDARRRGDESLEGTHAREREILGQLVIFAQLLLKETRALGAQLEASQLEVVRSICQVAMDPSQKTEEETANALSDAVRDMRPLLDDMFVAYLKYAVAEEEGRLARAGLLDDPEHNEWLFVLKIVQQGVYAEISRGINRYIEHIWYVLRMESKAERRMLVSNLIDDMPTMDVRPFVQVVDNIVASLGDSARGDFDGYVLGEMSNKLLQLYRDVHELLPPERIQLMSRDADEWAANQRKRLKEQRKVTQQRLSAARETEQYDEEIRRRGEMERIE